MCELKTYSFLCRNPKGNFDISYTVKQVFDCHMLKFKRAYRLALNAYFPNDKTYLDDQLVLIYLLSNVHNVIKVTVKKPQMILKQYI